MSARIGRGSAKAEINMTMIAEKMGVEMMTEMPMIVVKTVASGAATRMKRNERDAGSDVAMRRKRNERSGEHGVEKKPAKILTRIVISGQQSGVKRSLRTINVINVEKRSTQSVTRTGAMINPEKISTKTGAMIDTMIGRPDIPTFPQSTPSSTRWLTTRSKPLMVPEIQSLLLVYSELDLLR
jgi:hypothetical protein